jgi:hypothetical protein
VTGAAAIAFAVELAPLAPLRDWPPVAETVGEALSALRGDGSVSERDVQRIRRWSRRWSRLHPVLRDWYAEVAPKDDRVSRALLWLLTSAGEVPPDPLKWSTRAAMVEWTGRQPAFDPLPRMRDSQE